MESADTVQIELEMISVDGSPAVVRAARWLGEKLGLRDRPAPQRLQWSLEVAEPAATPVALTLDPGNLKPGHYIVELAVAHAGRKAVSRREILISPQATSSRRP
jgi:hypothetical protein